MSDVKVNFIHPTDGRIITVTLDATMMASEAISQLLANNFMQPHPSGSYQLGIKGGAILQANQTLADAGVTDNTNLRVISSTDAGGM